MKIITQQSSVASDDNAATTYVYAAERSAPQAYLWFCEFVIPVKYELANDFKNGVASVKIKDGNYIYINTKGEEVEIDD